VAPVTLASFRLTVDDSMLRRERKDPTTPDYTAAFHSNLLVLESPFHRVQTEKAGAPKRKGTRAGVKRISVFRDSDLQHLPESDWWRAEANVRDIKIAVRSKCHGCRQE